jgi:glycerol-3-phosphate dehydrogenase
MNTENKQNTDFDLFIIGGGINGCGIARDAAGRGYSVYLCEADDLASGTSSQSTKLIHGGLRYLEHYEFRLVREALTEREILWKLAPHIIHPMRFILPYHKGLRPAWLLRLGLFLYDHIGGRKKLPGTRTLNLRTGPEGECLRENYSKGFEYSDCWVNDSRLVVLNAMDAAELGAAIKTRHECIAIQRVKQNWSLTVKNPLTNTTETVTAKVVINAAGPWVDKVLNLLKPEQPANNIRLVQGSHIVVPKLYDHDKCYIFQNSDERITFAIPYHKHYTLIGTTDHEYSGDPRKVKITADEIDYLCNAANAYFKNPVRKEDIISTYAGVRSLYNDGASKAQEATRDYVLRTDQEDQNDAPLINIFGGKITTYRRLAESMLIEVNRLLGKQNQAWTDKAPLPGGDFAIDDKKKLIALFEQDYDFLTIDVIQRLINSYGTRTVKVLADAKSEQDLGQHFGHGLYQNEVDYLIQNEWALSADDILLRRTKLGLVFNEDEKNSLENWLKLHL